MSPYQFENVLVAVDGSEGSQRALDCALALVGGLGGRLTALAVEGKLPAYAASIGEVDDVKRGGALIAVDRAQGRWAPATEKGPWEGALGFRRTCRQRCDRWPVGPQVLVATACSGDDSR